MKQVVIIIGGGETWSNEAQYYRFLENMKFNTGTQQSDWKQNLQKHLGKTYDVHYLSMPNKFNATYEEWSRYFSNYISQKQFLGPVILVGHSLGALFWLST